MKENRALRDWMETSRRKNDFMELGCLTEVTDSYKDHKVLAYVVPIKRNDRGLVVYIGIGDEVDDFIAQELKSGANL